MKNLLNLIFLMTLGLLINACSMNASVTSKPADPAGGTDGGSGGGGSTPSNSPTASLTSSLSAINSSNYTSYSLSGTCAYSASLEIKSASGTSLGTTACSAGASGASGTWSLSANFTSLSDGNLELKIYDVSSSSLLYTSSVVAKDIVAPVVAINSIPPSTNNLTTITSSLATTDTVSYSYKLGVSAGTDCSSSSGYSSFTSVSTNLSVDVSAYSDGVLKLCLVARDLAGNTQSYASTTSYSWTKDTSAPTATLSGAPASNTNSTAYSVSVGGTGVTHYAYKLGVSSSTDCSSSTGYSSSTAIASAISGNVSSGEVTYKLCVVGKDASDHWQAYSNATSTTWSLDTTAPNLSGSVSDGSYATSLSQSPSFSWSAGSDTGGSGIQKYQIALGTTSGGTQTLNWTDIGNVTSYQVSSLSLSDATTYYPSIRVVDNAGNASTAINGDGWITDATTPTIASIEDGDQIVSTSYSSWIAWPAATETGSGLANYEVRIVDSGNAQVVAWTDVGSVLGYGFTGLTLTEGQTYKAEVRAKDVAGNTGTAVQGNGWYVVPQGWKQQAYLKAPNAELGDSFGYNVAVSADTIVVGAIGEDSNETTITNGTTASADNSASSSGAAYVYKRSGTSWAQEAYLKAPNAESADSFGWSVAISGDTIAVSAYDEASNQTTITNGTTASADNSAGSSGAVYVFKRTGTTWAQEAYLKAPNAQFSDNFGSSVSISEDSIVVGAKKEDSNQTTITNGTTASADNSASSSGAAYVFKRTGVNWAQQAYLKAPNAQASDSFGYSVSISGDTVVVGAYLEDSNQTTITNGATASADNSAGASGAVYVFKRTGVNWAQEAYLKAPNVEASDSFGYSVAISNDTVVAGSPYEDSNQTTITNGATASSDNSAIASGAAYVFKRTGTSWAQEAYLKAPNAETGDLFGSKIAIADDIIAVGTDLEDSNQTTITNGSTASSDNSATSSGAVYVFKRTGTSWAQEAYLKAPNAEANDAFGGAIGLSGETIVVGAKGESSNQTTITNGTTASSDNSAASAGAVYVFTMDRVANWAQQAYVKAPNAGASDQFGTSVAISGDTAVVGAPAEFSNQTTITNGTTASSDNSATIAGAVYVFKRTSMDWVQEAYVKPPNTEAGDQFGYAVAISEDTMVAGAINESSNQTTITNGTTASSNNSAVGSGAAYVFKRTGTTWAQQAYIKPPNTGGGDLFGWSVAISGDTIVVGAIGEDSNQTIITNGTTASADNSALSSGAVYVFKRTGTAWTQEAYLKAPNAEASDSFGGKVAVSDDTVIVAAALEDSNQTTITNGATASADNSALSSGAVYVFKRTGTAWTQEAYLKAPNAEAADSFGTSVSISGDTIVVGAYSEDSDQSTITNGSSASTSNLAVNSGAAYIFRRNGVSWTQEAYLKASNVGAGDYFGNSVGTSGDIIVVGAYYEASNQTTITNGTTASSDNAAINNIGAAYMFKRTGTTWAQEAYLKAPNAEAADSFGYCVAVSGSTVIVGAPGEDSNQTIITNGATASSDNSASAAGATYIFTK